MYDPALGRFHTIDLLADSFSFQTPYSYAVNNPIRLIDILGMGPGDLFKNPDKAAHDWGKTYNGRSIIINREFGSSIYVVEKSGNTFYTYTEPDKGTEHYTTISEAPEGSKTVANIHSHGAVSGGYDDNKFSNTDKWVDYDNKIDGYLATPSGVLKKYDVETAKETVVAKDLPSDPKDPERQNNVLLISHEETKLKYHIPEL